MERKILIPVAIALVALGAVSTFFEFRDVSGNFAVPVATNVYAVLTFLILIGVSLFMILKK